MPTQSNLSETIAQIAPDQPVLVAGPTASGKSALAIEIAQAQGGVIVNADASQVYACWDVITARPSAAELLQAQHALYGHIAATAPYSTGHWLREVTALLETGIRPIITGGTGLYFSALTKGLADIPATPPDVRERGNALELQSLLDVLDPKTAGRIDLQNRARVQRAWEVQIATGRGLADWQDNTGPPVLLPQSCFSIVFDVQKDWLNDRISRRFDQMLEQGALEEVRAQMDQYDPSLPAHRAIGVAELMAHLHGSARLEEARQSAVTSTQRFAKRQRTWMRSKMADWHRITPS